MKYYKEYTKLILFFIASFILYIHASSVTRILVDKVDVKTAHTIRELVEKIEDEWIKNYNPDLIEKKEIQNALSQTEKDNMVKLNNATEDLKLQPIIKGLIRARLENKLYPFLKLKSKITTILSPVWREEFIEEKKQETSNNWFLNIFQQLKDVLYKYYNRLTQ